MLIIFQWLFNLIIIISPIFGFFPQIIKVFKNKTDEGFNTSRVTLTYCSVFMEMLLNFSFNQSNNLSYKNQLDFLNHNSRLISLGIDCIFAKINKNDNGKYLQISNIITIVSANGKFNL